MHQLRTPSASASARLRRLPRWLWASLHSKHTGLGLVLGMAVLTLLGTVLDQVPDGVSDDPRMYAAWLADARARYGAATVPLARLGLFDVFGSVWFVGVSALLALSIIASNIHRLPTLWRNAVRPPAIPRSSFFADETSSARFDTCVPVAAVTASVVGAARRRHLRVSVRTPVGAGEREGVIVHADRFRFVPLATVISHTSFVLIIIGIVLSSTSGFREPQVTIAIGDSAPVGHGTGLVVHAQELTDVAYSAGRAAEVATTVVLTRDGQQLASGVVQVNSPLRAEGIRIHQSYSGNAVQVRLLTTDGSDLGSHPIALERTTLDGTLAYGRLRLPERDLEVDVATAAGRSVAGLPAGRARVDVRRLSDGSSVGGAVLAPGKAVTAGTLVVGVERERRFTGLLISRDPGAPWVWVGSGLMVIGLIATLFVRRRDVWVRISPHGTGALVSVAADGRSLALAVALAQDLAQDLAPGLALDPEGVPAVAHPQHVPDLEGSTP